MICEYKWLLKQMSPVNVMAAGAMILIKSEPMPLSVLRCAPFFNESTFHVFFPSIDFM
jgi:hypothetical protein